MTTSLESLLARIYTEPALRRELVEDPSMFARTHGLSGDEERQLRQLDLTGLELAAASFAHKRERKGKHRRSLFGRLLRR